ncbi:uncharacterized, partial [Tachysurus ichikawai]
DQRVETIKSPRVGEGNNALPKMKGFIEKEACIALSRDKLKHCQSQQTHGDKDVNDMKMYAGVIKYYKVSFHCLQRYTSKGHSTAKQKRNPHSSRSDGKRRLRLLMFLTGQVHMCEWGSCGMGHFLLNELSVASHN